MSKKNLRKGFEVEKDTDWRRKFLGEKRRERKFYFIIDVPLELHFSMFSVR